MAPPSPSTDGPEVRILLVEDSNFFGSVVRNRLGAHPRFDVTWVKSGAEALATIEAAEEPFFLAVLDLHLPDAPDGEVVDAVMAKGLQAVVLTAELSDDLRDHMWAKGVVDYIVKEGARAIDYLAELLERLLINDRIKVLVADDSVVSRTYICDLLRVQRYEVLEAQDGSAALAVLDAHDDVQLLITDFNMPDMNGAELVKQVRRQYARQRLAILGVSAYGSGRLSARFIKSGANDFLYRPFETEEFYCRVTENVRALEHLRNLEELANKDFLTGLFNRRYFFDVGNKLFENVRRGNIAFVTGMLDIDHFKAVNDTHGHEAGDHVLQGVAETLASRFRKADVVARIGGEEFCVLATNMEADHAARIFDEVRQSIEEQVFEYGETTIAVTVSIGLALCHAESFEATLAHADRLLYEAKDGGRNRVVSARYTEAAEDEA